MRTLARFGVTCTLPAGWEGAIFRRPAAGGSPHPVVHLANFPLPADRGDFGNGAVDAMDAFSALVVLLEHGRASAGTALFRAQGLPGDLRPADFSPTTLQRLVPGQAGVQRFFQVSGRPFCLYAVLGSWARAARLVPVVNQVLAGVAIGPEEDGG